MQNRSAILIFTVLLTLACLYSLSFSWFTSGFEADALNFADGKRDSVITADAGNITASQEDSIRDYYEAQYIRQNGNESLYPLIGLNYYDCEAQELKKGLDLEGGMSVTLEVSVPEMIMNLSGNSKSETFRKAIADARELQKASDEPFIDLFAQTWAASGETGNLFRVFNSRDTKEKFPANISDEEVITLLKAEAESAVANTEKILRTRIDKFGVTQPTIQRQQFSDRILVELPGVKDKERVRKIIQSTATLEFWEIYDNLEMGPTIFSMDEVLSAALYPDLAPLEEKITEETFEVDPVTGDTTVIPADTTAVDDIISEEESRQRYPLRAVMAPSIQNNPDGSQSWARGGILGYAAKEDTATVNKLLKEPSVKGLLPLGDKIMFRWSAKANQGGGFELYALKPTTRSGKARLDGSTIIDARQDFNQTGGSVVVSMQMNSEGAKIWKDMTREAAGVPGNPNDNKSIAIVLDDMVYTAPNVTEEIPSGSSQITIGGTTEQALREGKDLANLLKAGSLPAPAKIVDEQIIGPSIGADNIQKGMMSFLIALAVILLYMIFYYRGAGVVADIALIANMFFLLGALASIGASLTLPGIAGIILTIGMAVDANVLIFERVKEELRAGAGINAAINKGYQKAYSAIIDANLTTLFTAFVLLFFGTGPIKGFATTLIIGIFTSLFAAIFITRLIFSYRLDQKKSISFYGEATKNWFANTDIQWIKRRKTFYVISAVLVMAGIGSLLTRSLDFGVDFEGGRTYVVEFNEEIQTEDVRVSLDKVFAVDGNSASNKVTKIGATGQKVKITTNYMMDNVDQGVDDLVDSKLDEALQMVGTYDAGSLESKRVAPTISDDFKSSSMKAVIFALLIIFLYILFRFRKWQFGAAALAAMAHDVLIVLGLFSIFWGILPFSLEIDQAFIAAILTVVGYSINDTVIVFDRIREYLNERKSGGSKKVINDALNSTLSRTVNTSLSTFIVLFTIFLFGSDSIKGFCFALMVGVVVGTYSSLCIATPLVVDLSKDSDEKTA